MNEAPGWSDIIFEILLRLPVKSLLRFKAVCKKWVAVIQSPNFISQHFDVDESINDNLVVCWCQASIHIKFPSAKVTSFRIFNHQTLERLEDRPETPRIGGPSRIRFIVGPCRGIFCVATNWDEKIALWNPATRTLTQLPYHPLHSQDGDDRDRVTELVGYGLFAYHLEAIGFGTTIAVFKVVVIICYDNPDEYFDNYKYRNDGDKFLLPKFTVYNSQHDSWRVVGDEPLLDHCRSDIRANGVFVDGFYYWIKYTYDNWTDRVILDQVILAFDMHLEVFHEIRLPEIIRPRNGDLTLYRDDSLALLSYNADTIELWLIEESSKCCWRKLLTALLPFKIERTSIFWKSDMIFIHTESNDDSSEIYLYDLNSGDTLRHLNIKESAWDDPNAMVYYYKESLVSIKGGRRRDFDSYAKPNNVYHSFRLNLLYEIDWNSRYGHPPDFISPDYSPDFISPDYSPQ